MANSRKNAELAVGFIQMGLESLFPQTRGATASSGQNSRGSITGTHGQDETHGGRSGRDRRRSNRHSRSRDRRRRRGSHSSKRRRRSPSSSSSRSRSRCSRSRSDKSGSERLPGAEHQPSAASYQGKYFTGIRLPRWSTHFGAIPCNAAQEALHIINPEKCPLQHIFFKCKK